MPNKKALRANAANKKVFEANARRRGTTPTSAEAKRRRRREGRPYSCPPGSNVGALWSGSARDIVEALEGGGSDMPKSQVVLDRPIKAHRRAEVRSRYTPRWRGRKASTCRSPEEAELQEGVDVWPSMFEPKRRFTEAFIRKPSGRNHDRARREATAPAEPAAEAAPPAEGEGEGEEA